MYAGQDQHLEIRVLDEHNEEGVYHEYCIASKAGDEFARISFQKGPIENGINGIYEKDLLEVCRHHLQSFQSDRALACREYALALTKIEEALHWLNHRTMKQRRIEGTHE